MQITKVEPEDKYLQLSMNDFKVSRIKTGRASDLQKQKLIKYFEDNPDSTRVANMTGDSKVKQRVWIDLTHKLNSINGTMKTASKWSKYWCDIVNYTRNRAKRAISHQIQASNDRPPTDIEKRMLTVVGQKYLVDQWIKYWSELSTTNFKIKFESEYEEGEEEGEEESEWIDLSNDGLDEPNSDNNIDGNTTTGIESLTQLIDDGEGQNLQHTTTVEQHMQSIARTTSSTADEFENVCYELDDDTTIEFAECNDDYYQVQSNQHTDEEFLKASPSIHNLNEPDDMHDNDIIDENSIIMDERINTKELSNNATNNDDELILNESLQQPPRKKKKFDKNEIDELINTAKSNYANNNQQQQEQQQQQLELHTSFSDNNRAADENDDSSNDDIANAVYALSTAASSLATALKGLAKVLKKRKSF